MELLAILISNNSCLNFREIILNFQEQYFRFFATFPENMVHKEITDFLVIICQMDRHVASINIAWMENALYAF